MVKVEELKPRINQDVTRDMLQSLNYEIDKNYQFRLRDERTPSASIRRDGFIKDFGSGWSGDIFALLQEYYGMTFKEAVQFVANYLGISSNAPLNAQKAPKFKRATTKQTQRLPDDELIKKLERESRFYLGVNVPAIGNLAELPCPECIQKKITPRMVEVFINDEVVDQFTFIPVVFEKLFEGNHLYADLEVVKYILNRIVGYSHIFNCPVIVIRDAKNRVVDIAYYRPINSGEEGKKLPKYLYKSNEKKPLNRGEHFLYPFQVEMERLINKESFVIVGEGLKNAVNALIYKVPYISLEGAGNKPSKKLIGYIKELEKAGKKIMTAFDGDEAGEIAYTAFKNAMQREFENLFAFNSGDDFVTYAKGGIK